MEGGVPHRENIFPYSIVEVRPVMYGFVFSFKNKEEAYQAIKDFWGRVWSATPDMFARGMWKPEQELTGGADYRTTLERANQITEEQKKAGATIQFFIGGNDQAISSKALNALRQLGMIKG